MRPKVSIVIPFHWMKNWGFFLQRCLDSIERQSFTDYEIILMKVGSMPVTSNRVIQSAKGELVKVLYMDDYFSNENSLQEMVNLMEGQDWLICGTNDNKEPFMTEDIETGNNHLGSPSALMFRNDGGVLLFDERLSWLLDCDLYKRMYERYGTPKTLYGDWVTIGKGDHQMTYILTDEAKQEEHNYLKEKYAD